MIRLTKDNVALYVKSRIPDFNLDGDVHISAIGEGSQEEDGDGFINFVYRVSDETHKLIVKQSSKEARSKGDFDLSLDRYKLEYESMKIHKAIVPDLLPDLYDIDTENRIFITEDVSHLKISRFQLIKGVQYPKLADQVARFMAASEFYTSRYYLDSKTYRGLDVHFMNVKMRKIIEDVMFLTAITPDDKEGRPLDPDFERFARFVIADERIILARTKLRHLFMNTSDCLIHGDLHTSNIFASQDDCKIIDMEYAHYAPFAYDMGYFLANFIAQYCAATFRPFESEEARASYKEYCIKMIHDTYMKYCEYFITYCHQDSLPEYRNIPGLEEDFCMTALHNFIGFAASPMLGRICNLIPYADYDEIKDPIQQHNAKCMSIILNRQMLLKYENYESIDEFIDDIKGIEQIYCRNIKDLKLD